jgi:hypothetical protein
MIFLNLSTLILHAQNSTQIIKGNAFITKKQIVKNEWGNKDTLLRLYRVENGKEQFVLKHYLYKNEGGDCNNIFWNSGTMKREGDQMVFITHFRQKGNDPIPQQEKQIYKVAPNGHLKLSYHKYYQHGKWVNEVK